MPKMITQHRRGTKTEWENSAVKPADGELVVEQQAGFAKLKIGDGKSDYSALPYVTDQLERKLNIQNNRVDNLVAIANSNSSNLTPGSLESEVVDIRAGYDGISHGSAGSAIRAIGYDLLDLKDSLQNFINADAVDGLEYEDNMLYLTASGQRVGDGVEVIGGSGGGSGTGTTNIVRLKNLNSDTKWSIVKGNDAIISFEFISTEDGEPTGDGSYSLTVNGVVREKGTVKQGFAKDISVTKYLISGENKLKLTCEDIYGVSRSINYTINVIELRLTSAFDAGKPIIADIDFRYIAYGVVDKTIYFELDGRKIAQTTLKSSTSGKEVSQYISLSLTDEVGNPLFTHGSHTLKVYAKATYDNLPIESNVLSYALLVAGGDSTPIIASVYTVKEVEQGTILSIPYLIYHGNKTEFDVELKITYIDKGEEKLHSTTSVKPDGSQQYWQTRNYPVSDQVTFWIIYKYGENADDIISISHTLKVTASTFKVESEAYPKLFLSSQNRSNTEEHPDIWTFTPELSDGTKLPTITSTFEGFNWKSNGWLKDSDTDDANTCLRINGNARTIINFAPFSSKNFDIANAGLTIELEFAIRDVNNRDSIIAECFADGKGIQFTADTATISSAADSISCNYRDNEKLRLAFTIDKTGKAATGYDSAQFLSVYLNGVLSRILRYTNANFNHDSFIKLGSDSCSLDIYSIRVYDKALSADSILNNYLADIGDPDLQKDLYYANALYDNDHKEILFDKVKEVIPVITFTGKMPTYKGDKQIVEMDFIHPTEPDRSFSKWYGGPIPVEIDVQGTSSQYYIRKNWKIKIKNDAEGNKLSSFQHMKDQIPAKVFCIKVDYAEATGTHNTQNANYVETFYTEQIPPQKDNPKVRTTIAGYPCAIFQRESINDPFVFSSKGNFNFDKGSEDAFGFNGKYDTECWEFCNNTSDSCNFKGQIPTDWVDDFEPRYHLDEDALDLIEKLQEEKENATNKNTGEIDRTQFTEAMEKQLLDTRTSVISEFRKVHDWVVSTNTTTATNLSLDAPVIYNGIEYTIDSAEYRLAKFRAEFDDYFDRHYSSVYYVYTFVALMTDQRAKNLFLTRWKVKGADGVTRDKWYPYFYDNDTCFGINNEGQLVFDYYHEDIDKVKDTNVYNGQESILWTNFSRAFASDIAGTYATLRSSGKLTYNAVVDRFITKGSDSWAAAIYNEDAEYKYVGMARPENAANNEDFGGSDEDETGKLITANLYQVRGTGEHHLRYFIENRIRYCDSKWNAGSYPNDYVLLRVNTPTSSDKPSTDILEDAITLAENENYRFFIVGDAGEVNITISSKSQVAFNYQQTVSVDTSGEYAYTFRAPYADEFYISTTTEGYELRKPTVSDPELAASIAAYPPNPQITVTPFSTMYAGVKYKANGTLEQHRTYNNESFTFGTKLNELFNDTETAVFGAKDISSLGDLSRVYPSIVDVSSALKLTELIIGAPAPYRNKMLHSVQLGTNYLLKTLNIENCTGLSNALDVSACANIENIHAIGSSITSVKLPAAGYLKKFEVPGSITTLVLTNQLQLTTDNIIIGEKAGDRLTSNLTDLVIDNCTNVNVDEIFRNCFVKTSTGYTTNLKNIRLTGVKWSINDWHILEKLYTDYNLKGLDANGAALSDAIIPFYGTCHINNDPIKGGKEMTGADLGTLHEHFPYLAFSYDKPITFKVTFKSDDGTEILREVYVTENSIEASDCPDPTLDPINPLAVPERSSDIQYSYIFDGWSANSSLNRIADKDILNNIVGDIIVYPAFKYVVNEYDAWFYQSEAAMLDNAEPFYIMNNVQYGRAFDYDNIDSLGNPIYPEFDEHDTFVSDLHPFARWSPRLLITEDTLIDLDDKKVFKTAAIYFTLDEQYEIPSISENTEVAGAEIYVVTNSQDRTLAINSRTSYWSDEPNVFVRIPANYYINGTSYTVDSISGFDNFNELQLIDFGKGINSDGTLNDNPSQIREFKTTASKIVDGNTISNVGAFQKCSNLIAAVLPRSLRILGQNTFAQDTNIKDVYMNAINLQDLSYSNPPFNNCGTANGFIVHIGPDVTYVPKALFYASSTQNKSLVNSIDWGETPKVYNIRDYAFYRANLKELTFPESLTEIGSNAFTENHNITELTIPSHIKTVKDGAFREWDKLTKLTVPERYTDINNGAFGANPALNEIEIISVPQVELEVPVNVYYVGESTNGAKLLMRQDINDIHTILVATAQANTIPANTGSIASYAFSRSPINSINFEAADKCTSINSYAFYNCSNLVGSVTADGTFTNLKIPNSVTSIGEAVFYGCSKLTGLDLSDNISYIGGNLCANCTKLSSVHVPKNMTKLGYGAFRNCGNLTQVDLSECTKLTDINDSAFSKSGLTSIVIPDSVTNFGTAVFQDCTNLTNITLSNNLKTIPYGTFSNTNLTTIELPENVKKLESTQLSGTYSGAFANCKNLETVIFNSMPTSIEPETFKGCGSETVPLNLITPDDVDLTTLAGYSEKWGARYLAINGELVKGESDV